MASRLKAIHAAQIHSHQSGPVAPMSHKNRVSKGRPITAPSTSDFIASCNHRTGVILLKPKRCSSTNVMYSENGSSSNPLISVNAATNTTCCTRPVPSHCANSALSVDSPDSKVQPKVRATPHARSNRPKRVFAIV